MLPCLPQKRRGPLSKETFQVLEQASQITNLIDQERNPQSNIADFLDATNGYAQRLIADLQDLNQAIDNPLPNIDETKSRQDLRTEIAERLRHADKRLVERSVSMNDRRADLLRVHMEPIRSSEAAHDTDDPQRRPLNPSDCDTNLSSSAAAESSTPSSLASLETDSYLHNNTVASSLPATEEQALDQTSRSSSPSNPVPFTCRGCKAGFDSAEDWK